MESAGAVWLVAASWGVTGLGWLFVAWHSNRRAAAAEVFHLLTTVEAAIEDLVDKGERLWLCPGEIQEAKRLLDELVRSFRRLIRQMTRLRKRKEAFAHTRLVLDFKREVTGGEAESRSRIASPSSAAKFERIHEAAHALISALDQTYNAIYNRRIG